MVAKPASRVATEDDIPVVAEIISAAFHEDPVWSWAFPDPVNRQRQYMVWWTLFAQGAVRHNWVWLIGNNASTSIWLPPGCPEMSEQEEAQLEPMLQELVGDRTAEVLEGLGLFDSNHPEDECYYLSLWGTHPDRRGGGIGTALMRDNLARIDEQGAPAYLESSNPVNIGLYESLGFRRHGSFTLPSDGPTVTTMWRDPRPVAD
jgi:ribosomal protein S18 acetylase RimI-like enzyme